MKKVLVFMAFATLFLSCGKSKYDQAIEHLNGLQVSMETCVNKATWDSLQVEIVKINNNPIFDNRDGKYTRAEADTIAARTTKLIITAIMKQSELWHSNAPAELLLDKMNEIIEASKE